MALELVTPLPPGAPSHTRLARHGARLVVLREIKDGTDCSWPQPSPSMVTLQEVGELQGKRHALFPWVPGVTLREVVKALEAVGRPVPIGLAGRVLVDAARALAAITPARAHGGLQDAALQIGFDGQVSVLDFGAPRISRFRPIGRVNFAADVFALGGVLHSVLTGFAGDYASPPVTLANPSTSHAEATPAIDDVVMRALSAQPDSRQAGAAAFADELEAVLGDELFTPEKLAEVVTSLFKDRIKLLHSLGGLIEDQPSLEAVLPQAPSSPMAPIPQGTQPGVGGPHPEPPSEPTLPRIMVDERVERTDTRIPIPVEAAAAPASSRSMVPWDSGDGLPPAGQGNHATEPLTRPDAGPALTGPRPGAAPEREPDTNPRGSVPAGRVAEPDTNPRAVAPSKRAAGPGETGPRSAPAKEPSPADTDESSSPRPRGSAPRPLGAEEEHAPTRPSGPRAMSRTDVEAPRPRASAPRPADSAEELAAKTVATDVPDDTNPRARPDLVEDTNPRARPRKLDEEVGDTGPRPGLPPRPRNTTEAERQAALGQERLRTPPQGVPLAGGDDDDEIRNEPTALRPKLNPHMTAQTAQTLPAPPSSGVGLRVVMVVLLVVVVGLAGAIVLKLKRQSELPLPVDEPVAQVDAGEEPTADAGDEEPAADGGAVALGPDLDGGEEEEEDDDADAGEPEPGIDAGAAPGVDGGTADAGNKPVVKKPVKKPVKKKKKKKRR
ncbi:MAG: hypothetical protein Q8L48_17375 [Archangium sp.]|nr:hypothetical protein [Archangium sp.]